MRATQPMRAMWLLAACVPGSALGQVTAPAAEGRAAPAAPPGAASAPAVSQADQRVIERSIAELDADDLTTRELATERLGQMPGLSLDDVLGRLASDASLTSEQRHRLERVAAEQFARAPKAALGVAFGRQVAGVGVEIAQVVMPERFPAADVLQAGDFITHVEGRPVRSADHLRAVILSHRPGASFAATIRRGDRTLDLSLPLGDYTVLERAARIDEETARAAVRERMARLGVAPPEPAAIGSALTPEAWVRVAQGEQGPIGRGAGEDTPGAVVGGAPRSSPAAALAGVALSALPGSGGGGWADLAALSPEQRLERYQSLSRQLDRVENQILTFRALHDEPDIDADDEGVIVDRIRDLVVEQRRLEADLEALRRLGVGMVP